MKKPILAGRKSIATSRKATHDDIARLAHALYEKDGRPEGKQLEHWFNAESMIEANFGYGESHTEHDFSRETSVGERPNFSRKEQPENFRTPQKRHRPL